jgi:hypothetical protein
MWPRVPGHFSLRQAKFWKGRGRHRRPVWAGKVLGQLERSKVGHSPVPGRLTSLTWAARPLKRCWDGRQRKRSPARGEAAATRAIGGFRVRRKVAVDEVRTNSTVGSRVLNCECDAAWFSARAWPPRRRASSFVRSKPTPNRRGWVRQLFLPPGLPRDGPERGAIYMRYRQPGSETVKKHWQGRCRLRWRTQKTGAESRTRV